MKKKNTFKAISSVLLLLSGSQLAMAESFDEATRRIISSVNGSSHPYRGEDSASPPRTWQGGAVGKTGSNWSKTNYSVRDTAGRCSSDGDGGTYCPPSTTKPTYLNMGNHDFCTLSKKESHTAFSWQVPVWAQSYEYSQKGGCSIDQYNSSLILVATSTSYYRPLTCTATCWDQN